ncbi:MAG: hypothetical protein ACHBN1_33415 [Heteroscytonema crispum UTEX LB 1556]
MPADIKAKQVQDFIQRVALPNPDKYGYSGSPVESHTVLRTM